MMHKILKYKVDRATGMCLIPCNARIIRVARVDDGFYDGDFLWAIVNPEDPLIDTDLTQTIWMDSLLNEVPTLRGYRHELLVKEKQTLTLIGRPWGAQEEDGKLYVYHNTEGPIRTYTIAFYKTGQTIDIPISKLQYLGLCRLWIIQELGLYCFLVND